MANSKHTDGPWEIEGSRIITKQKYHSIRQGSDDLKDRVYQGICHIQREPNISGFEAVANARLIAAAPELLEALELAHTALSELYDHDAGEIVNKAIYTSEKAIAKARG